MIERTTARKKERMREKERDKKKTRKKKIRMQAQKDSCPRTINFPSNSFPLPLLPGTSERAGACLAHVCPYDPQEMEYHSNHWFRLRSAISVHPILPFHQSIVSVIDELLSSPVRRERKKEITGEDKKESRSRWKMREDNNLKRDVVPISVSVLHFLSPCKDLKASLV